MGLIVKCIMYRVIALGYRAGMIVDRLRARKEYDDIKFVYCNTDSDLLRDCGNENDEHIHLVDMTQCREAIHEDNDQMAVLITTLGYDFSIDKSREYASEIMSELCKGSARTYCFATLPFAAGGNRPSAIEIFNTLTCLSDISVCQDDSKEPYNYSFMLDMDRGLAGFINLILSHPRKGRSVHRDRQPFGVWATEKQLWMALHAMYSNNMPEYYKAGTFSFHKRKHELLR